MIVLFLAAYTAGASLVGLAFVAWLTVFGWWLRPSATQIPTATARCRWCAKACGVVRGRG